MNNKKLLTIVLSGLIIFFALLRLFNLAKNPTTVNRDEAALAYNAFLLSETGYDEWHTKWPLAIKSFGDYKLPGYVYTLIPLFKIFSANDFWLRLPACLAGIVIIVLSFYFARKMGFKKLSALVFTLAIAITPVFFFYSRMAWEANLGLSLFLAALVVFIKGTKKQVYWGLPLIFLANLTYNTPYLLLPFLIMALMFWQKYQNKKINWSLNLSLVAIFIISTLIFLPITKQKSGITIFTDPTVTSKYVDYRLNFSGLEQKILGNKYVYYLSLISKNLINSFSYKFLVKQGGAHPWHAQPGFAHLFNSLYFIGLFTLIFNLSKLLIDLIKKRKINSKLLFLYFLLFASLVPSIVTTDSPHATRSLLFFYLYVLNAVWGIEQFYLSTYKKRKKLLAIALILVISITTIDAFRYYYSYFTSYPHQQTALLPGYNQVLDQIKNSSENIAVVDPSGYQYIITAWYLKMPAKTFLNTVTHQNPDQIGLSYGERINNYHFIAQAEDKNDQEKILLIWENGQWVIKYY